MQFLETLKAPLALSPSRPLALSPSRPLALSPSRPLALSPNSKHSCGGGSPRFFHRSQAPQTAVRTTACLQRPTGSCLPSVHRGLPALGFTIPAAGFPIRASRCRMAASKSRVPAGNFPLQANYFPCSGSCLPLFQRSAPALPQPQFISFCLPEHPTPPLKG